MSSTVNVARYTALATGIFYGIAHRRTLQEAENNHKIETAIHRREHLIHEAREAWKAKQASKKEGGVITNPEDPNFDLEKLISSWEAESK
ncbi:hypothetical protein FRC03_010177 [Tulasnella sp. 419]|nr:hypothetical protein FRC02_008914 [Tulasnella sp. 418]KAG8967332.1 hypothetical protein FRC03_010177 [Tulasnella sp. 419]